MLDYLTIIGYNVEKIKIGGYNMQGKGRAAYETDKTKVVVK